MKPKRRRKWLSNILLILGSLLFASLIGEVGLRILGLSYPLFMQVDPVLGWKFRPNTEGWSIHERKAYVRTNAEGFRDFDHKKTKGENTYRIAVLGDSFTEASNVSLEEAFPKVIEMQLKTCPRLAGKRIECLNFGVSGYGTAQEYLLLQREVVSYHPDLVVLGFFNGNDVGDNVRDLSIGDQKIRPYYQLKKGRLILDNSFRSSKEYRNKYIITMVLGKIINHSYLLQTIKQIYVSRVLSELARKMDGDKSGRKDRGPELVPPVYREMFELKQDQHWAKAWSITEALLVAMRNYLQKRGIDFLIIVIPSPVQAHPVPEVRQRSMEAFGLQDLSSPEKRMTEIAVRHRLPVLMLLDPMQRVGEAGKIYFYGFPPHPGFGHWNEAGNRLAGEIIARHICKHLGGSRRWTP